jgi:hypothetical protein
MVCVEQEPGAASIHLIGGLRRGMSTNNMPIARAGVNNRAVPRSAWSTTNRSKPRQERSTFDQSTKAGRGFAASGSC